MRRLLLLTFATSLLSAVACSDATSPPASAGTGLRTPQHTLVIPSTTPQVSTGHIHTCALRSDGTVLCWVGNPAYAGAAVVPTGLASVAQISAGGFHSCALKTDGAVVCWGDGRAEDDHGQASVPAGLGPVAQVSAGAYHTCVVKTDETVVCWGGDDGSIIDHNQSIVPGDLGPVKQVGAGGGHTCALKVNQTVACWGYNVFNQATVPPDLTGVVEISSGYFHTCARKTDRTVVCWGSNHAGNADVPVGLADVLQVSAGAAASCVRKTDSTVLCWGDANNDYGIKDIPADLGPVAQVSIKYIHVCALRTNGTVRCWEDNGDGRATVPEGLNLVVPFAQSIGFTSTPPSLALSGRTYAVSATGGASGNPVTFTSLTPSICSVNGGVISLIQAGSCSVAADQAGGTGYLVAYTAALQVTQQFTVLTPAQAVQNLLTTIAGLGLPASVMNSLSAPLQNINTGNLTAACGKLNAFVSQVNAKLSNGQLTASDANQLLEAVNAVKASLGCA